jgi:hypothetical protein
VTQVEKATEELRKLQEARARLEAKAVMVRVEVARLREETADRAVKEVLEPLKSETREALARASKQARARTLDMERELEAIPRARRELAAQIRPAIEALGKARADVLRAQAKTVAAQLEKHAEETARLLAALVAHEGVRYEMVLDDVGSLGVSFSGVARQISGAPAEPKCTRLAREIERLEGEARNIEKRAQQNAQGGAISGAKLEDLLPIADDIERIAPTRAAINDWFAQIQPQIDTQWRMQWAKAEWMPPFRTTYMLTWDADGAIYLAKSRFDNHRVLEPMPWPKYYKPAKPITVPVDDRGLVAIPRLN